MNKEKKNYNLILFSSGVSEQSGLLQNVKDSLINKGYHCAYWRDLFRHANDPSNIALLPSLIKKIPTFDYAILICEGHDRTIMQRNGEFIEVNSMRDNVLFEIGLCAMALGLSKTILVADPLVHMPEDLLGKNGTLAIKKIEIGQVSETVEEIDRFIQESGEILTPVVIGAASSSAEGYANNFILRTLEHIEEKVLIGEKEYQFPMEKIYLHIMIPQDVTSMKLKNTASEFAEFETGVVPNARSRSAVFRCQIREEELHIYDFPTSIVTSYHTAKMILNIDADDGDDLEAGTRFVNKELHLFEATLKALLKQEYVSQCVETNCSQKTEEQRVCLVQKLCDLFENRLTYERFF